MATPTLTPGFTVLSTCDAITGWSAGTVDTEVVKQGTASLSGILRTAGLNTRTYTTTTFNAAGQHLRMWLNFASIGFLATAANGGIRLFAQDTGGAIGYWYLGGIDTYDGGWTLLQVDMDRAFDAGSANMASINRVGFTLNLTGSPRNAVNTWYDYLVRGNGLTITGGTAGDPVAWNDIALADAASGYGAVRRSNGVFFVSTSLVFGGAADTYFEDTNQIVVFENQPVNADLYKIEALGAGATSWKLTSAVLKSANPASRFDMLLNNAALDALVLTSNTLVNADAVSFKSGQTTKGQVFQSVSAATLGGSTVEDSVFSGCGQIAQAGATVTACAISGSTAASAMLADNPSAVSETDFTSAGTGHAMEITAPGTFALVGVNFAGYGAGGTTSAAIYNNSGGAVTLNISGGNTPTVRNGAGASTLVNNAVSLTISATNTTLAGAEVRIYDLDNAPAGSLGTELAGTESNPTATFVFSGDAANEVWIQILKAGFREYGQPFTMPAFASSLPLILQPDTNA